MVPVRAVGNDRFGPGRAAGTGRGHRARTPRVVPCRRADHPATPGRRAGNPGHRFRGHRDPGRQVTDLHPAPGRGFGAGRDPPRPVRRSLCVQERGLRHLPGEGRQWKGGDGQQLRPRTRRGRPRLRVDLPGSPGHRRGDRVLRPITATIESSSAATGLVRSERQGKVFLIGLNRPDKHNALDQAMVDELDLALIEARRAPCVLIVHSTSPGIFAAGADIAEMVDRDADAALRGINAGLFDRIEAHRWPSIAVIDGPAYGGGCELALACDLRIASPNARFAQPELGLGILAGAGANWRLPQAVGLPMARRMLYTGEVLDADAAAAAGLIDTLHPADELLDQAIALAERIATRSWRALELTKLALQAHRPATTSLDVV